MRVIAGVARGRRLAVPAGRDVRPTSDRVREAVFSSLVSMNAVDDARVLDLFAGSGALGIEALNELWVWGNCSSARGAFASSPRWSDRARCAHPDS